MTFLELMVALMILGVLMAVAIPRMVGTTELSQLRGAAREMIALMRYARTTAVFGEVEVEMRFSPEEGLYRLAYDPVAIVTRQIESRRDSTRGSRRAAEGALERAAQWTRIRSFPTDRMERPTVRFAAVETEIEVAPERGRGFVPAVVFFPDGTASGGTIVLQGKDGGMLSIEVLTATGMAEVREGDVRRRRTAEEARET